MPISLCISTSMSDSAGMRSGRGARLCGAQRWDSISSALDSSRNTRGSMTGTWKFSPFSVAFPKESGTLLWETKRTAWMKQKTDVQQGTLALMALKTLEVLGPLHGYGIARRIEETSKNRLSLNYGTLYPALLKLEQEGFIKAEWRQSENNRRAKFYALIAAGRKQLAREMREWHRTADLIAAFFSPKRE